MAKSKIEMFHLDAVKSSFKFPRPNNDGGLTLDNLFQLRLRIFKLFRFANYLERVVFDFDAFNSIHTKNSSEESPSKFI